MAVYLAGTILLVILAASRSKAGRAFLAKRSKLIFAGSVFLMSLPLTYLSYRQYELWKNSGFGKFFLPPFQTWNYFFLYAGTRFFAPYAISLAVAVLFLAGTYFLNHKFGERFFEKEEIYLAAISLFLVGYPGLLIYAALFLLLYLSLHVFYSLKYPDLPRLSMYHLWVPLALFVIIVTKWLVTLPVWTVLKV